MSTFLELHDFDRDVTTIKESRERFRASFALLNQQRDELNVIHNVMFDNAIKLLRSGIQQDPQRCIAQINAEMLQENEKNIYYSYNIMLVKMGVCTREVNFTIKANNPHAGEIKEKHMQMLEDCHKFTNSYKYTKGRNEKFSISHMLEIAKNNFHMNPNITHEGFEAPYDHSTFNPFHSQNLNLPEHGHETDGSDSNHSYHRYNLKDVEITAAHMLPSYSHRFDYEDANTIKECNAICDSMSTGMRINFKQDQETKIYIVNTIFADGVAGEMHITRLDDDKRAGKVSEKDAAKNRIERDVHIPCYLKDAKNLPWDAVIHRIAALQLESMKQGKHIQLSKDARPTCTFTLMRPSPSHIYAYLESLWRGSDTKFVKVATYYTLSTYRISNLFDEEEDRINKQLREAAISRAQKGPYTPRVRAARDERDQHRPKNTNWKKGSKQRNPHKSAQREQPTNYDKHFPPFNQAKIKMQQSSFLSTKASIEAIKKCSLHFDYNSGGKLSQIIGNINKP